MTGSNEMKGYTYRIYIKRRDGWDLISKLPFGMNTRRRRKCKLAHFFWSHTCIGDAYYYCTLDARPKRHGGGGGEGKGGGGRVPISLKGVLLVYNGANAHIDGSKRYSGANTCRVYIATLSVVPRESTTYDLNEDSQPAIHGIGVSHTDCKEEIRQNLRYHSWREFLLSH